MVSLVYTAGTTLMIKKPSRRNLLDINPQSLSKMMGHIL